ncbi:NADH dehydrogenase [ubiquinone] iron-sulfur protein 5 [Synchiropus picturatus]
MPFWDLQSRLGIDVDGWLTTQSNEQPNKKPARCHVFQKEWIECAHGIGLTRAKKECQLEFEDFYECMHRTKLQKRLEAVRVQREKLIKEGKYTPPLCHSAKVEDSI